MSVLFISDLHLKPEQPAVAAAFFRFIREQAPLADALYILGDLFEVWVGDDDDEVFCRQVITALRNLSDTGVPLYFMHGNRDFLIGQRFAQETGATLLEDPTHLTLFGQEVVLMHGDSLCTDDAEYMEYRAMVRNPQWQQALMDKPLAERRGFAKDLRETSKEKNRQKPMEIQDVVAAEVDAIFENSDCRLLIHGHTHRPEIHSITKEGCAEKYYRIVLGDWHSKGWYLMLYDAGFELVEFEIESPDSE
ncbi:MAG: UDP-2,3-diacylglucosamine diphosphatase [Pseudomonadales bacterium]|nr:UDP-2,3-diacylglucosamine diphosphatase [Pseudomonadales bacterium]